LLNSISSSFGDIGS